MEITEIVLLAAGGIIFILSFLIPDKKGEVSEQSRELVKEEIADMVNREIESVRGHVDSVVEEAVTYAMEKTERSLERLSNEKIMAVNEYSDTVMSEIHKNHEEAMFLYDMLNSKHANLKDTVSEVNRTLKEVEEKISSLKEMTSVPAQPVQAVLPAAMSAAVPAPAAPRVKTAVERLMEHNAAQSQGNREFRPGVPGTVLPGTGRAASTPQNPAGVSAAGRQAGGTAARGPRQPGAGTAAVVQPAPAAAVPFPAEALNMPPSAAGRVSFLDENTSDGQNNNERILKLHRQGKSKVAIAKELGLGVGEVKLVIDLFQNQQK